MAGVPHDRLAVGADAIIVRERRPYPSLLYGALLVLVAVALVRGLIGAHTVAGRVTVAVVFGALTAVFAWMWVTVTWRRGQLEVTGQAITYISYVPGRAKTVTLSREQGEVLRIVSSRYMRSLTAQGTSTLIPMNLFRLSEVRQACTAMGWPVQPDQGPKAWSQVKPTR